ncbi:MAG: glycosyltransferase [Actinomycetota bacterium]
MSDPSELIWHRASLLGDIVVCHRWLQTAGSADPLVTLVALAGEPSPELQLLGQQLAGPGIEVTYVPTLSSPPDRTGFDIVIHVGLPPLRHLTALAQLLARDGLLLISTPHSQSSVDLIDELHRRFASVRELAQTRVIGSAITDTAQGLGYPRISSWTPGGGPPAPGAPREHSLIVTGNRSLDLYPTHSVMRRESRSAPLGRYRPLRHLPARAARYSKRRILNLKPTGPQIITVPSDPSPVLSIVIPVHGNWPITEQCLASLEALGITTPTEVIVVNDASPDDTLRALERVRGATVIDLPENVGFLRASNAGLERAMGDLVLFLNNDTIPQDGSLDSMVARMLSDPAIGVVGAKLVYLDRSLQEAGGVVWSDASGWNVGRNQDPDDPRYAYPRDVDYCSGAALLVRRSLLDQTGGFDPRYSPAYYEDTDLCFEARRRGLRVVYEPSARVVHLEGKSHGTSIDSGIKRYQELNRSKFAAKWHAELTQHLPPEPANLRLAVSRLASRRILVIDHTVPTHDRDGGSLRMLRLLQILRELDCFVWFYPADRLLRQPYTADVLDLGVEVVGRNEDLPSLLRELGSELDAAILSRRGIAWQLVDTLRDASPSTPLIFDTVDLHFVREEAQAELGADVENAARARRGRDMELALVSIADQTWVVSTEEEALLAEQVPAADIRLVPNVHDATPTDPPYEARHGLIFVGNFNHPPNIDALTWAVEEILPIVRAKLPEVRLHVVGDALPISVERQLGDGCIVHGWVHDLSEMYASARLAIAPLRFGAGMKGKVTEALAMGVPVVTTPTGSEGMPDEIRALAIEGVSAEEIARLTIDAYSDPVRWNEIHESAPAAVEAAYGRGAVEQMVERALQALKR